MKNAEIIDLSFRIAQIMALVSIPFIVNWKMISNNKRIHKLNLKDKALEDLSMNIIKLDSIPGQINDLAHRRQFGVIHGNNLLVNDMHNRIESVYVDFVQIQTFIQIFQQRHSKKFNYDFNGIEYNDAVKNLKIFQDQFAQIKMDPSINKIFELLDLANNYILPLSQLITILNSEIET
jgi:hypothetical protein